MKVGSEVRASLVVQEIAIGSLQPNHWNPNRVPPDLYAKLRTYLEREGFVEPLVVRPKGDRFEILGGFHRWKIAGELGYTTVPCVVVDLDDRRAKILSINLNELKGQSVPSLLAELIHDLSRETTLDDLASQLPWDAAQLADFQELLKIPDGLLERLEEDAARMERERPRVLSFVLSPEQEQIVEEAVAKALGDVVATSRGAALTKMASTYLGRDS